LKGFRAPYTGIPYPPILRSKKIVEGTKSFSIKLKRLPALEAAVDNRRNFFPFSMSRPEERWQACGRLCIRKNRRVWQCHEHPEYGEA
jgi:hypothetical protein